MPAPKGNKYALGNNGGRPTEYVPEVHKELAFNLALSGATGPQIAKALNVTLRTLYNWAKHDKEFFQVINEAKRQSDSKVVGALYEKALNGDTTAQIFWLKNRQRDKWNAKDNDNQGIQVTINRNNTEITKDNQTLTIDHD